MIERLRILAIRVGSLKAKAGGWRPYLRMLREEMRHEGAAAKLRRALLRPAPVPEPPLPPIDVTRIDPADAASAARAIALPTAADPVVSIVIPVFNQLALTLECLAALARHPQRTPFEVIVVDDASGDATASTVPDIRGVRYLRNAANLGFIGTCNRGVEHCRGRYLLFLNNDTQVQRGWLDALVGALEADPRIGMVGPKLLFPDGRLQEAGARLIRVRADDPSSLVGDLIGIGCRRADPAFLHPRDVEYCSGACLLVRRDVFAAVGGLDPAYAPAYFEDADLAYKVRRAGYRVRYEPAAEVVHHLSASTGDRPAFKLEQVARNAVRFAERWSTELERNRRIRLLTFYLPQFHPTPENDAWWGKGFTEWTNVTKAQPNFAGHHQPQLPGELGFYDLRLAETRQQQADLARQHGVHGFCYYYYWFDGKRLLHRPLDEVLATGAPDFPFCVCWANENWTRTWDGQEQQVLIAQRHSPVDDLAFIRQLLPALRDRRYVRIDGRPLLLVYKVHLLPDPAGTAARWRDECRRAGIGEIYLGCVHAASHARDDLDPRTIGFDAAVEFPPARGGMNTAPPRGTRRGFRGLFFDYATAMARARARPGDPYVLFRGVMPSWDNTARRQDTGHIFLGSSPERYAEWLAHALDWTARMRVGDERLVFINAWNEWAEGNHLEPDRRHGRAYLEATRAALAPYGG